METPTESGISLQELLQVLIQQNEELRQQNKVLSDRLAVLERQSGLAAPKVAPGETPVAKHEVEGTAPPSYTVRDRRSAFRGSSVFQKTPSPTKPLRSTTEIMAALMAAKAREEQEREPSVAEASAVHAPDELVSELKTQQSFLKRGLSRLGRFREKIRDFTQLPIFHAPNLKKTIAVVGLVATAVLLKENAHLAHTMLSQSGPLPSNASVGPIHDHLAKVHEHLGRALGHVKTVVTPALTHAQGALQHVKDGIGTLNEQVVQKAQELHTHAVGILNHTNVLNHSELAQHLPSYVSREGAQNALTYLQTAPHSIALSGGDVGWQVNDVMNHTLKAYVQGALNGQSLGLPYEGESRRLFLETFNTLPGHGQAFMEILKDTDPNLYEKFTHAYSLQTDGTLKLVHPPTPDMLGQAVTKIMDEGLNQPDIHAKFVHRFAELQKSIYEKSGISLGGMDAYVKAAGHAIDGISGQLAKADYYHLRDATDLTL